MRRTELCVGYATDGPQVLALWRALSVQFLAELGERRRAAHRVADVNGTWPLRVINPHSADSAESPVTFGGNRRSRYAGIRNYSKIAHLPAE